MDYDDLQSEIRAAGLSVEDLDSRAAGAEAGQGKELEIDATLIEQELDELDRKLDELRGDWEAQDQLVHPDDAPDFAELDRALAAARDSLGDTRRRIDEVPELGPLERLAAWTPDLSPDELERLRDPGLDV